MKIIAGLGNPGKKYQLTRHNVGFLLVDQLAEQFAREDFKLRGKALVAEAMIEGEKVLLVKPQTFMNLSGQGILPLSQFYKIAPDQILVVYDDLDLPVGRIRLRPKGGSGGHRGVESIIQLLGTQDFPRLKIGIGRPPAGWETADYVLSQFTADQWPVMVEALEQGVQAVRTFLKEGINQAMNKYN